MASTIGHSARHGGLRGHSVGDIYPLIMFFQNEQWRVMHCGGEVLPIASRSARIVHRKAQAYKREVLDNA